MNFFVFSSRRRHTRCGRDWSSDVCSSDLRRGRKEGREKESCTCFIRPTFYCQAQAEFLRLALLQQESVVLTATRLCHSELRYGSDGGGCFCSRACPVQASLGRGFCWRPFCLMITFVLDWSLSVVKRSEVDAVPCRDCLNLVHPLRSDEASSNRERFEATFQSKSHTFEQTSVNHIGEWVPIQNSVKIWRELQSARNLSQASEEDLSVRHLRIWRKVLRIACVANDGAGRDAAEQQRRRRQTRRADYEIGDRGHSLRRSRDLYLNSIVSQLCREPAQSLQVACDKEHAFHQRRHATRAARSHISGRPNYEQRRSAQVALLQRTHLPDSLNDETDGQRIACGEHRVVSRRKLI